MADSTSTKSFRFWYSVKGKRPFLYREEDLKTNGIVTEDEIKEAFPDGGLWVTMDLIDPFTMADDARVRAAQTVRDAATGLQRKDPDLFNGCLLEVAVDSWTLPYSKDRHGYAKMTPKIAGVVSDTIIAHCYDGSDHEDFLRFLERKPKSSSETAG